LLGLSSGHWQYKREAKTMTKKQKAKQTKKQIREMMKEFQAKAINQVDRALMSGTLNDNSIFFDDNYLLAKAILDSSMRDRPYKPFSMHKADFDNLHNRI
jgi:hypothetical protein